MISTRSPTWPANERVAAGPSLGALPTLWIHGTDDTLVPLEPTREALAHLRGAHLVERIYTGGRHEMFNETYKDAILADLIGFIDRASNALSHPAQRRKLGQNGFQSTQRF